MTDTTATPPPTSGTIYCGFRKGGPGMVYNPTPAALAYWDVLMKELEDAEVVERHTWPTGSTGDSTCTRCGCVRRDQRRIGLLCGAGRPARRPTLATLLPHFIQGHAAIPERPREDTYYVYRDRRPLGMEVRVLDGIIPNRWRQSGPVEVIGGPLDGARYDDMELASEAIRAVA